MMQRLLLLAALVAAPLIALRADAPHVYAIRGARIVTASGAPIEAGTIVVRGGVIDAVGASTAVPSDALVIEGAALAVCPGPSDSGNTRAAEQQTPPAPRARTTAWPERSMRAQLLQPQARAADARTSGARARRWCGLPAPAA